MNSISITLSSLNLEPGLEQQVRGALVTLQRKQKDRKRSRRWQIYLLTAMLCWIVSVSMYDVYWSFKTQDVLIHHEENPLGVLLINADGGDIALFMTLKSLGNLVVLITVPLLYMYKRWWGLTVASGLSLGQATLMFYLNFGHLLN